MKKIFYDPETGKEWWIEVDGNIIRSCLNNGKIKEKEEENARNKVISEIMAKMRKGFIYRNPDASFGEPLLHCFLEKAYTGSMPLAVHPEREEFYAIRTVGDFEDELLFQFDGDGNLVNRYSLGAKRMTYNAVLAADGSIYMDNDYRIEKFIPGMEKPENLSGKKNSFGLTMLDVKKDILLQYSGKEIVVRSARDNTELFRKTVKCEKTGETYKTYYCFGLLSPQGTKLLYRVSKEGYWLVDLHSGTELFLAAPYYSAFFSPDDKYLSIGGHFFDASAGMALDKNPFPFDIPEKGDYYDTYDYFVCSNDDLMAVQSDRYSPLEIWDYQTRKQLAVISDDFIVKSTNLMLTKDKLILHTDYGVLSVYNLSR